MNFGDTLDFERDLKALEGNIHKIQLSLGMR